MHWMASGALVFMLMLGSSAARSVGAISSELPMGVAVGSGLGVLHLVPYRAALLWDLGPFAFEDRQWRWVGFWEASTAYWDSHKNVAGNKQITLWTSGPQARFQRTYPFKNGFQPYGEVGIGASWLSNQVVAGRNVGMHFLFEDRIGFGFRFGSQQKYDINARVMHYSHASMVPHNPGVNMFLATIGSWF